MGALKSLYKTEQRHSWEFFQSDETEPMATILGGAKGGITL